MHACLQDGTPLRGEVRDKQDVKKAATIAGGVAGFFLGGPFGAVLVRVCAYIHTRVGVGVGVVIDTNTHEIQNMLSAHMSCQP